MKHIALIVAGGSGVRMGTAKAKQFLELNGKAILLHAIDCFLNNIPEIEIIVVLPEKDKNLWDSIAIDEKYQNIQIAIGGDSRFQSVKNGLKLINENCIVGIHDAVRPFVSKATIIAAYEMASLKGSAVPVTPLKDSIREISKGQNTSKDRVNFRLVQTPQCFQSDDLIAAYNQEFKSEFTDDASVFESFGKEIFLVDGNPENIKITGPEDLLIAQHYLGLS